MKTLLYLFTGGRRTRLTEWERGAAVPLEFLYGAPYLQQHGYTVDLLELADLRPDTTSLEYRRLAQENARNCERYQFYSTSHQLLESLEQLNSYDAIIAGGEDSGAGLAYFARHGRLTPPFFFFVMGMLDIIAEQAENASEESVSTSWMRFWHDRLSQVFHRQSKALLLYRQIVEQSAGVLFFGMGEFQLAARLFPRQQQKFHFLPFAVDTNFWQPAESQAEATPSILFMGKDHKRDFELVVKIAAALPHYHFILISRNIPADAVPPNAELFAGDWKEAVYSDAEIRALLQQCRLVILPLKESAKPSGQSVALQAMACGKPVLISHTAGFWEPDRFHDREHLYFIHSNSLDEWTQTIDRLMRRPEECDGVGRQARLLVEDNNHLEQFGAKLEAIVTGKIKDNAS